MAPNPDIFRCPYELSYEPDSDTALHSDVLARVRFGSRLGTPTDPREIQVALTQIGAAPIAEVWRSRRPVVHGWADGLGYAHNGEVLFGHLRLDDRETDDLGRATASAYARMDTLMLRLGYPCPLRVWNFLSHINRGEGDAERYRQFSQGRHHSLALKADFESGLPAATAIGTPAGGMTLYFLAAREAGEQVENPRQVSAFRYPAVYGPSSPSFSRATLKHWADGVHLLVSGTASVVGHESLHREDPLAQLDETHRNIEALLQQAASLKPSAGPFRATALKIFVRHEEHLPELLARARQLFGAATPLLCLAGDICRRDLLLEIEGLYTATPWRVSGQAAA